jgi:hypothetical protein
VTGPAAGRQERGRGRRKGEEKERGRVPTYKIFSEKQPTRKA